MKKTHIIALVFIAISIAVIISMTGDYSRYETFTSATASPSKDFHIVGELVEDKEIYYNPEEDPNHFTFYLKDKSGTERKVIFNGAKPQDFERSEQIVLTGGMNGDVFMASKILMKCPSKYVDDELEVSEFKAAES
ncbi:MAG: cytochrome c maturation protein CcmE [Chitinophagales bacterium]